MKHLKSFEKFEIIKEELVIVDEHNIEIEKFDNELTPRENWDLNKWSGQKSFDNSEINKLSRYFGKLASNNMFLTSSPITEYQFKLNYGGYGKEKYIFRGYVYKKSEYDNSGRRMLDDVYYLIDGYIKVNFDSNKGERAIFVKFNTIRELIQFFQEFEKKIKFNIESDN